MTDTLESLRAEWEARRNYDPYALIKRLFEAAVEVERELVHMMVYAQQQEARVAKLREALEDVASGELGPNVTSRLVRRVLEEIRL